MAWEVAWEAFQGVKIDENSRIRHVNLYILRDRDL